MPPDFLTADYTDYADFLKSLPSGLICEIRG